MNKDRPRGIVFPPTEGENLVLLTEAIDGDTVRFFWLIEGSARLFGINAPELEGTTQAAGEAAKKALQSKLPLGPVMVKIEGREKFGRTLMTIPGPGAEDSTKFLLGTLNKAMVDGGFAKPWDGKGPRP